MKSLNVWQLLAGFVIGAIIVYFFCCRHSCPEHALSTHQFKIWKGFIEKDTSSDFTSDILQKVSFLGENYYQDIRNGNKELPRNVVYVHTTKVPLKGSPYESIENVDTADGKLSILTILSNEYLDSNQEFLRCGTTGRIVCIPDWKIEPSDTLMVGRAGESSIGILIRLQTYVHEIEAIPAEGRGNQWEYALLTASQYKQLTDLVSRGGKGECSSLVFDDMPEEVNFSDGVKRKVYTKPIFR
jgi:hypothetical protein